MSKKALISDKHSNSKYKSIFQSIILLINGGKISQTTFIIGFANLGNNNYHWGFVITCNAFFCVPLFCPTLLWRIVLIQAYSIVFGQVKYIQSNKMAYQSLCFYFENPTHSSFGALALTSRISFPPISPGWRGLRATVRMRARTLPAEWFAATEDDVQKITMTAKLRFGHRFCCSRTWWVSGTSKDRPTRVVTASENTKHLNEN